MNISNYSDEELLKLKADIDLTLRHRQDKRVEEARKQIEEIANTAGISLKDLLPGTARPMKAVKTVLPKFRNPENKKEEWTGRGRQPQSTGLSAAA